MSIHDEITLARRFFNDMRNVMTDEQLLEIARKLWDLQSLEGYQPCYFTECFASRIVYTLSEDN